MTACDRCGRPITGGRWSIPAPGGVVTVCTRCIHAPMIAIELPEQPRVVLMTKDGTIALPDASVTVKEQAK